MRGAPPEVKLFASPTPDKCSMGRNTLPSHRPQTATEQKKSATGHWGGRSQVTRSNLVSFYNSYYKPGEAVQHPEELWIFKNGLVKQKNWCSNFLLRYEPDLRLFRSWGDGPPQFGRSWHERAAESLQTWYSRSLNTSTLNPVRVDISTGNTCLNKGNAVYTAMKLWSPPLHLEGECESSRTPWVLSRKPL